jgi:hypothetical protein
VFWQLCEDRRDVHPTELIKKGPVLSVALFNGQQDAKKIDDNNPAVNPGAALDTTITYNGDFVVMTDDYIADQPTGDIAVSALLEDSAAQPIIGKEVLFEIYNTGGNLITSASVSAGNALTTIYNLQVGIYNIGIKFIGDECYYHSSETSVIVAFFLVRC